MVCVTIWMTKPVRGYQHQASLTKIHNQDDSKSGITETQPVITTDIVAAGIGWDGGIGASVEALVEVVQTFDGETQCATKGDDTEDNEDPLHPPKALHIANLK